MTIQMLNLLLLWTPATSFRWDNWHFRDIQEKKKIIESQLKRVSVAQAKANFAITWMRATFHPAGKAGIKKKKKAEKRIVRDLEGKLSKIRYSDSTDAEQREAALLHKMKSNSPFPQQQPPAHHFSWPLQCHNQPSFAGHTPMGLWSLPILLSPGNLLQATIYLLSLLSRIATDTYRIKISWVLTTFWENNVGFVEEEITHVTWLPKCI